MTVTQRKPQHLPDEIQSLSHIHRRHIYPLIICVLYVADLNEPGVQYQCDSCACDLTHTVRIKCANPICLQGEGIDLCPACFCAGKEFGRHKRGHAYRVIVRGLPSNVFVHLDWLEYLRKWTHTPFLLRTGEQTSEAILSPLFIYHILNRCPGNCYC